MIKLHFAKDVYESRSEHEVWLNVDNIIAVFVSAMKTDKGHTCVRCVGDNHSNAVVVDESPEEIIRLIEEERNHTMIINDDQVEQFTCDDCKHSTPVRVDKNKYCVCGGEEICEQFEMG